MKNPPMKFMITPEGKRIGRHRDVEPFVIQLHEHRTPTAQLLGEKIQKAVHAWLLSDYYPVSVDLDKGTFQVNGGRYAKGVVQKLEEE